MQSPHLKTRTINRSASPNLHSRVYNEEEESRVYGKQGGGGGFGERSILKQSSGIIRSRSPDHVMRDENSQRLYSPSFGKSPIESFVVLDQDEPTIRPDNPKRVEGNHHTNNHLIHEQGKTKSPTNWMPPWYDSNS